MARKTASHSNEFLTNNNSKTLYTVLQNKKQTGRITPNSGHAASKDLILPLNEFSDVKRIDQVTKKNGFNIHKSSASPTLPRFESLVDLKRNVPQHKNDITEANLIGGYEAGQNANLFSSNLIGGNETGQNSNFFSANLGPQNTYQLGSSAENNVSHPKQLKNSSKPLRLDTTMLAYDSETASECSSAVNEELANLEPVRGYLTQSPELLYRKYTRINKLEDARIRSGTCSGVSMDSTATESHFKRSSVAEHVPSAPTNPISASLNQSNASLNPITPSLNPITPSLNPFSVSHARKSCNYKRNRYSDISPYNYNRVRLEIDKNCAGGVNSDYINASFIELSCLNEGNPECFIASQGPTKSTYKQFWQMCYDQGRKSRSREVIIVMVTPLIENRREKCYPYWPSTNPQSALNPDKKVLIEAHQTVGNCVTNFQSDLELELIAESHISSHSYTQLTLTDLKRGDKVKVHHLYYDKWEDFSSPKSTSQIIDLILHTNDIRASDDKIPIVTHCSAGVGRTGTFLALFYLYNLLEAGVLQHTVVPDPVEATVKQLRLCRMKMVQTFDQFQFIYGVLRQLLGPP